MNDKCHDINTCAHTHAPLEQKKDAKRGVLELYSMCHVAISLAPCNVGVIRGVHGSVLIGFLLNP